MNSNKYKTQLQIVKRGNLYVVQIRRKRFFTRRWYWKDLHDVLSDDKTHVEGYVVTRSGYQPVEKTKFEDSQNAKLYCRNYLQKEISENKEDVVVKTFNTGLDDIVWPGPPPRTTNTKKAVAYSYKCFYCGATDEDACDC